MKLKKYLTYFFTLLSLCIGVTKDNVTISILTINLNVLDTPNPRRGAKPVADHKFFGSDYSYYGSKHKYDALSRMEDVLPNGCPAGHPYPYNDGNFCCKYDAENVIPAQGEYCDGSILFIDSKCCKNNEYKKCLKPPCVGRVTAPAPPPGSSGSPPPPPPGSDTSSQSPSGCCDTPPPPGDGSGSGKPDGSGGSQAACVREVNINYAGHNIIRKKVGGDADCPIECAGIPECKFWSFNIPTKDCYLKDKRSNRSEKKDVISGTVDCAPARSKSTCVREVNTNYNGHNINKETVAEDADCSKECVKMIECKFWTFNKYTKVCIMMDKRSNRFEKKDVISGTRGCASGGISRSGPGHGDRSSGLFDIIAGSGSGFWIWIEGKQKFTYFDEHDEQFIYDPDELDE